MFGRIPRWLIGLVSGASLYLTLAVASELILRWYGPYRAQAYPLEEPCASVAIYAILLTLSLGLRLPFSSAFSPTSARLISGAVCGGLAALCLQLAGIRRGAVVFLALFAILGMLLAFLTALMVIG